jgi:hypothetical protein
MVSEVLELLELLFNVDWRKKCDVVGRKEVWLVDEDVGKGRSLGCDCM